MVRLASSSSIEQDEDVRRIYQAQYETENLLGQLSAMNETVVRLGQTIGLRELKQKEVVGRQGKKKRSQRKKVSRRKEGSRAQQLPLDSSC